MIKIGQPFPSFQLPSYLPKNKDTKDMLLSDFSGKWCILFYYPADFTFVCPTELKDLARQYSALQQLGAEIFAVSTDTVYTHKAWLDAEKLIDSVTYPMGADHAGTLARELGILNEKTGMADRAVYMIDPDGNLQALEIVADNIGRSAAEILRKLKSLDYVRKNPGHACPISWDADGKDLKPDIAIAGKVYEELQK
jgi:peroxiredoxin (alkyl hydroperoxide reductase subunit C)